MAALLVALLLAHTAVNDRVDLSEHVVVLSLDDGHHSAFTAVYPLLKRYGMTMTLAVITSSIGTGRPAYGTPGRAVNRSEIQEMIDSCGIEVASHTNSHARLSQLDSTTAWQEIRGSKLALESLFNTTVVTLAYPYGDQDARIRRLVRRAGYRLARATRPGEVNLWTDRFRLPEFELRREVTLEQAKAHVRRNRISVLLLHRIVDRPQAFTEWPAADLAELLRWLHRHGARTATLANLYYDWLREEVVGLMVRGSEPDRAELFEDVDVDATRTPHPR